MASDIVKQEQHQKQRQLALYRDRYCRIENICCVRFWLFWGSEHICVRYNFSVLCILLYISKWYNIYHSKIFTDKRWQWN